MNKTFFLSLLAAGLLSIQSVKSQEKDSLTLATIISEVVQNHPAVKKAAEDLNSADAKIGIARSNALPNVDFTSSYSRIGPVPVIDVPNLGSFSLVPHDNYSAAFNVNQTIYDFGKTDRSIELEKEGKELGRQTVEQVKQKLSQAVISNYYSLVYLQEALKIKDEQLNTLNEHLSFIKKKQETGSATQYEILTTEVRISTIQNQRTDLETARQIQVAQLNALLGKPESTSQVVKNELQVTMPASQNDALIEAAMQNRDEMKLASEKTKLAQLRYNLTDAQNNPVINGFVSGGIKNGYTPYLYDPKANFVAGLGLKIPLFDGKRSKYNLQQAQSAIQGNDQETEITRRGIVNEVVEGEANVQASQKKVDQGQLQLKQAAQAYALAKVRFESGVITNVELLDGSTAVSESRLQLLKAKIDYTVSVYKLKSAIGERLY
ncbi:MAG TPA: TolC family protein [Prolixibacteraceae bacterium]|nr:TolC family protein [Prolixibacteraceae bacterium]